MIWPCFAYRIADQQYRSRSRSFHSSVTSFIFDVKM